MELENFNKTVKQYKQGNLTASFTTELITMGTTSIPNLLLRSYKKLDITDQEMMIFLQLLRLRTEEKIINPTPEYLSQYLTSSFEEINNSLNNMLENEIISYNQYYDEELDEIITGYDLEPLMEKLSEIWACSKMHEIERTRCLLDNQSSKDSTTHVPDNLYHTFEKEFGRPLSPMEIAQIKSWVKNIKQEEIILEALKRAVLIGKLNFKYIDSILQEWSRNNLYTLQDIENYDHQFHSKKSTSKKSKNKTSQNHNDKRKEFMKTLYMG
ncbi:MAG: DnaD domain protein [Clostridiales bacterium]|nr:DnaD domain protein [Clostridiales bacterium]MCF8021954.1 DnaD domain protein [Clostridiales bacterium]